MTPHQLHQNEDGYMAILASLMFLALLTILGLAASRTANTEVLMSGNEIRYQRNFYRAEGAAMEAADLLQHTANLAENIPKWLAPITEPLTPETVNDYWDNSEANGDTIIPQASGIDPDHTLFIVGTEGVDKGGWSLDESMPKVYSLAIYGRCDWDGTSTIKVGYRMAY